MKRDLGSYLLISAVLLLGGVLIWIVLYFVRAQHVQPWIDASIHTLTPAP